MVLKHLWWSAVVVGGLLATGVSLIVVSLVVAYAVAPLVDASSSAMTQSIFTWVFGPPKYMTSTFVYLVAVVLLVALCFTAVDAVLLELLLAVAEGGRVRLQGVPHMVAAEQLVGTNEEAGPAS